ncbi:DNA polymerase delta subunit 4-like [Hibiscus syriacus]|uniref:DNA polymerase delta subunit 4-like n=1 Tax=Hibiscus syriacus TaxID=106335 RepID=UPI001922CA86|nr:DNA polymerase delta subunit 4-like [Hibiscus syriacus]
MARISNNMRGFYRQKKKNHITTTAGGITKSKSSKSTKTPSFGSDITQTPALDVKERALRQFDMNMAYGPCLGITRVARWERAQRLGLDPPKEIQYLLKGGNVKLECLLDESV